MLTGEPLALDLVNTQASTPDGEIDVLADLGGLRTWLDAQSGRLVATGSISDSDLAAVRELRHQVGLAIEAARCGRRLMSPSPRRTQPENRYSSILSALLAVIRQAVEATLHDHESPWP